MKVQKLQYREVENVNGESSHLLWFCFYIWLFCKQGDGNRTPVSEVPRISSMVTCLVQHPSYQFFDGDQIQYIKQHFRPGFPARFASPALPRPHYHPSVGLVRRPRSRWRAPLSMQVTASRELPIAPAQTCAHKMCIHGDVAWFGRVYQR